jgi:surface antigen
MFRTDIDVALKLKPMFRLSILTVAFIVAATSIVRAQTANTIFASPKLYDSGGAMAFSVAVGDLNGDGKPDLVVANACTHSQDCRQESTSIGVLLGNGDGTFQPPQTYPLAGLVAIADVNGDGKLDIVTGFGCDPLSYTCDVGGAVGVALGNGDGTFQATAYYSWPEFGVASIQVVDVNGDGKPDILVVGGENYDGPPGSAIGVFLNSGNGTFQSPVTQLVGSTNAVSLAVADLNGDNKPDLVVASSCPTGSTTCNIYTLLGNGDGTFTYSSSLASGGYNPTSLTIGDVNDDGIPDIIVSNSCASEDECAVGGTIGVLLGKGGASFLAPVTYPSGGLEPDSVAIADVNGDGHPDLVVFNECVTSACTSPNAQNSGGIGVLLGNGAGTFGPAQTYSSGVNYSYPGAVVAVDLNGDRRVDVAIAQGGLYNADCLSILLNISNANPAVTVTPTYLVFPNQPVHVTSAPMLATVTNAGSTSLVLSASPTVTGFNFSDFGIDGSTTCVAGKTIAPGDSCQVSVTFSPLTEAAESATVLISDNASASPQVIPVSGGADLASVLPNPLLASEAPQTVTMTGSNFEAGSALYWQDLSSGATGCVPALMVMPHILTTSMTASDSTNATWQVAVVPPDAPCPPTLPLTPAYSFEVITSGGGGFLNDYPFQNAPYCSNSTSTKKCPSDTDDPYEFFFRECTSYVAWRMNRDAGTPNPRFPSFFNSMDGNKWRNADYWNRNATDIGYVVDRNPEVGAIAQWVDTCSLPPGSCPDGHVAYVEEVTTDGSIVVSEYNYKPDDNNVSGQPGDHQFGIRTISSTSAIFPPNFIHIRRLISSEAVLAFATVPANSAASPLAATFTNPGSDVVNIKSVVITGKNAIDFSETNTCLSGIVGGGSCQVTVTFTPSTVGPRSASLILEGTAGPLTVSLTGTGIGPLDVSPQALSFTDVPLGTSSTKTLTLANRTGASVAIASALVSGSTAFSQSATTCGTILNWKSSCTIRMTFSPPTKGKYSGVLTVTDSSINSPQIVSLTGKSP